MGGMSDQGKPVRGTRIALFSSMDERVAANEANALITEIEARYGTVFDIRWEVTPTNGNLAIFTVGVLFEWDMQPEAEEEA